MPTTTAYKFHHQSPKVKPEHMMWPEDPRFLDDECSFWIKRKDSNCLDAAIRDCFIVDGESKRALSHTLVTICPKTNNS